MKSLVLYGYDVEVEESECQSGKKCGNGDDRWSRRFGCQSRSCHLIANMNPKVTKWLLAAVAVVLAGLSIYVMISGFSEGTVASILFGISGVLICFLAVAILVGIFVPSPLCVIVSYYFTCVLFFINLAVLVFVILALILGWGGKKSTGPDGKTVTDVGAGNTVVCLINQLLLAALGYLIYQFATKNQELPISHTPLDMLKCHWVRGRPAASAASTPVPSDVATM